MVFLLYFNSQILESYGSLEVLRLALLVLIYKLYSSEKINKISYKNLEKKLTQNPFTVENFNNQELKEELIDIEIKIEIIDFIEDDRKVLQKITHHIKERFDNLEEILSKDVRITATVPGVNAFKHRLGTMYIEDWKLINLNNYKDLAEEMHQYIAERIVKLVEVYNERIKFKDIAYENASSLSYQLWSANAVNYDLPKGTKIPGDYQAQEVKIQDDGIYGIIVTPRYGF